MNSKGIESKDSSCKPDFETIDEINKQLQTFQSARRLRDSFTVRLKRKHPAHGVFISATKPTIVFGTICCDKRLPWLATDRHHDLLLEIWDDISHWVVGRYILMPDHLHFFAAPQETAVPFDNWVQYVKSQFTKRNQNASCVWQTDHWDTRIRSLEHYEEKSFYMFDNPVRAGLVTCPKEWKHQGIAHELRWN